jgi:hypothetical protein
MEFFVRVRDKSKQESRRFVPSEICPPRYLPPYFKKAGNYPLKKLEGWRFVLSLTKRRITTIKIIVLIMVGF